MSLHALLTLAEAAGGEAEKSETPFFVIGCLFAAWAVVIGIAGTRSPSFASGKSAVPVMIGISVLLAVATGAAILYVSN